MLITNGTIADAAVIWAKLDGEIRGFIVETGTPGFRATPIQRKFFYLTSPTAFIDLKDWESRKPICCRQRAGLNPYSNV